MQENNLPNWVVNNRRKVEELRSGNIITKPIEAMVENPLQIKSKNLQMILDENGINSVERLEEEYMKGFFKSPKHKQIIKNFIEAEKEKRQKEIIANIQKEKNQ